MTDAARPIGEFAGYELFKALKQLEWEHGSSAIDALRIKHRASLSHAGLDVLGGYVGKDGRRVMESAVFGLLGPNGPMPLRLTEEAIWQSTSSRSQLADFLSLLGESQLKLFYRAWVLSRPEESARPQGSDSIGKSASLICGATESSPEHLTLSPSFLGGPRGALGLRQSLQVRVRGRVLIDEHVGEWLRIGDSERWTLPNGALGRSSILGSRVWTRQFRFNIRFSAASWSEYLRLLPSSSFFSEQVTSLVKRYLKVGFSWSHSVGLRREAIVPGRLGADCRLGETAWLGLPRSEEVSVQFSAAR